MWLRSELGGGLQGNYLWPKKGSALRDTTDIERILEHISNKEIILTTKMMDKRWWQRSSEQASKQTKVLKWERVHS